MVVYILFYLACDYAHRGEVTSPNYEGLERVLQSTLTYVFARSPPLADDEAISACS